MKVRLALIVNGVHPSTTQVPDAEPTADWNLTPIAETLASPVHEPIEVPRALVDAEAVEVPELLPIA